MRYLEQKTCETCKTVFKQGYTISKKDWAITRFCSLKCRRFTSQVIRQISETKRKSPTTIRGEKHHAWKGGISGEQDAARHSKEYKIWRDSVYRKDKWTCQDCGLHCQKGNIVAHHLISFADHPELRFVVENGQVLCRPCHAREHKEELTLARSIKRGLVMITHT